MDIFIHVRRGGFLRSHRQSAKLEGEHGIDPERMGVFVGAGLGGITTLETTKAKLIEKGLRRAVSPLLRPRAHHQPRPWPDLHDPRLQGPQLLALLGLLDRCTLHRRSGPRHRARRRRPDDRWWHRVHRHPAWASVASTLLAHLSTRNDEPTKASRPFEKNRDGFVMGEGAAPRPRPAQRREADPPLHQQPGRPRRQRLRDLRHAPPRHPRAPVTHDRHRARRLGRHDRDGRHGHRESPDPPAQPRDAPPAERRRAGAPPPTSRSARARSSACARRPTSSSSARRSSPSRSSKRTCTATSG